MDVRGQFPPFCFTPGNPLNRNLGRLRIGLQILVKTLPDGVEIKFVYCDLRRALFPRYSVRCAKTKNRRYGASDADALCLCAVGTRNSYSTRI
jgi:hypothetical protein